MDLKKRRQAGKLFKSLVFSTMLASAFAGQQAAAAIGNQLKPVGSWSVSKVANTNGDSLPYCALARRFQNNIVVTLARNTSDESSLAIDFQAKILGQDRYQVMIDPGFGQNRSFMIEPVSDKAFVVRMGQDYAFHDALNRSGNIRVAIDGKDYNFDMAEFSDGQSRLTSCLSSLPARPSLVPPAFGQNFGAPITPPAGTMAPVPPAPQAAVPLTPPPADYSYVANIEPASGEAAPAPGSITTRTDVPPAIPQVNTAETEALITLREENARLRSALEKERRNFEQQYMQEGQTSSQVAELTEKLELLQFDNARLRDLLSATEQTAQSAGSQNAELQAQSVRVNSALEAQIASLKAENESLKTNLQNQQQFASQLNDATSREMTMQAEIDRLRGELSAKQAEIATIQNTAQNSAAQLGARETALNGEIQNLRTQLQQSREALAAMERGTQQAVSSQLSTLQQRLDTMASENQMLKSQLASQNQTIASLQANGANETALMAEVDRLRAELATQSQMAASQSQNNNTQAQAIMAQKDAQIASLQSELANVRQNMSSDSETARILAEKIDPALVDRLSEKVRALEEENKELKAQAANNEAGAAQQVSLARLRSVEERLRLVSAERDELQNKIDALSEGRGNALIDIATDNWNLEEATRQFNAAEKEVARLRTELKEARQNCAADKKELEYMLFDPEIADQEQIDRLVSLEAELKETKKALELANLKNDASFVTAMSKNAASMPVAAGQAGFGAVSSAPAIIERDEITVTSLVAEDMSAISPAAGDFVGGTRADSPVSSVSAAIETQTFKPLAPLPGNIIGLREVEAILSGANIGYTGNIKVENTGRTDIAAYSWENGALYGSVEIRPMSSGSFDMMASSYLENIKGRCGGDFASIESMASVQSGTQVQAYEIACVNEAQGSGTAAVVFYSDGSNFVTIAHETSVENMDVAMNSRDRVYHYLKGDEIAMR